MKALLTRLCGLKQKTESQLYCLISIRVFVTSVLCDTARSWSCCEGIVERRGLKDIRGTSRDLDQDEVNKCVSIRRGELRKIPRWHEGDRRTWGDGVLG
jgi:hypothetical protein